MPQNREQLPVVLSRLERLHNLDAQFLYFEDDESPMHLGCACVFEGPVPTRHEVSRLFSAKLALGPRYRKRVRFVPLGLGPPVWADDQHSTSIITYGAPPCPSLTTTRLSAH